MVRAHPATPCPCSSTERAPDYESGGWTFESFQGYAVSSIDCGEASREMAPAAVSKIVGRVIPVGVRPSSSPPCAVS